MTHLFLFTLTPVQSFISQARKTQDLWAGSRMLSDLVKEAIETIQHYSHFEAKVIFPAVEGKDLKKITSLPNRLLAEFTFSNGISDEEIKKIGQSISNAIARKIGFDENGNNTGFIKEAKDKIGLIEYAKIKTAFEAQLKDYFSTFWVFVEVENGDYVVAYDKADRLLGAVKNSRTFTQNPEQGRKCSLSGEQNALVFSNTNTLSDLKKKFVNVCALVDDESFGDGEGLSAVSYLKRIYQGSSGFPSTAKVALMKDLEFFGEKVITDYKNLFKGHFDEQLYFEENLTKDYFKKHALKKTLIDDKVPTKIRDTQKILSSKLKTKYYAILLFDADSMGAWLSGEYLSDRGNQLQDFHTYISGLLSGFADYAKNYVDGLGTDNTKKGRTVYAGGDDYLGFVNLHYLFDVMKHLREQFKIQVSNEISKGDKFSIEINKEMSFSAGIAIAHYKTPLSEVLTWARKMEKEAKETDKKNSFGIAVLKKSGEIHKAVLPFKTVKEGKDVWYSELMREIRQGLQEHFSNKYITSLQTEMELLAEKEDTKIIQIMNFEIERLVLRAKNTATKDDAIEMAKKVKQVYEPNKRNIKNFNASLSICDFINRKLQGND